MPYPTNAITRLKQTITAVGASPATGQGDLSLGAAYDATFFTFQAKATSGLLYEYMIKEGSKVEWGFGTPVSGTPWTFQRTQVKASTAGVGVKETFTAAAILFSTPTAEGRDLIDVRGRHALSITAGGFTAAVTNGPASTSLETTTNKVVVNTLDFDPATVESAQVSFQLPPSYDSGVIRAKVAWKHLATTTNFGCVWRLSACARGDNEALELAFGTTVSITDTGGTTNNLYVTAESADITIAGSPQPNDWVHLKVERLATDASDTLAVDAQMLGVQLFFNVNAAVD